jgi:hypothetical protein
VGGGVGETAKVTPLAPPLSCLRANKTRTQDQQLPDTLLACHVRLGVDFVKHTVRGILGRQHETTFVLTGQ